ncbi:MAG: LysR family transcriptional regulator [Muribaculaceae bacterium]|nr:LysR family transcriptional regulator [Muribaculaceae bacterium]
MELRQLKYFLKVAETLSFSEAARLLYVTQSTLSQQIKQLENELGGPLFVRSSHSVSLSETGREILPLAKQTIADADMCVARIADINNLRTGTLDIGVTYSFSPILTETLIEFRKLYPDIKLNIYYKPMAELMEMLKGRSVDFVLAFKPGTPMEGIESHILFQNYLAAVVRSEHPLASRSEISIEELGKYSLALPTRGLQARNAFEAVVADTSKMNIKMELNEVNILLAILRRTSLVSVLAEATIHNESGVKAIRLDIPDNEMAGCVHTLKGSYRKRVMQEFLRMLSDSPAVKERRNLWI